MEVADEIAPVRTGEARPTAPRGGKPGEVIPTGVLLGRQWPERERYGSIVGGYPGTQPSIPEVDCEAGTRSQPLQPRVRTCGGDP